MADEGGLSWIHLVSLALTWSHLGSLIVVSGYPLVRSPFFRRMSAAFSTRIENYLVVFTANSMIVVCFA